MPELKKVLGTITAVSVGVTLITSSFFSYMRNERLIRQSAALLVQVWYRNVKNKSFVNKTARINYIQCERHRKGRKPNSNTKSKTKLFTLSELMRIIKQKKKIKERLKASNRICCKTEIPDYFHKDRKLWIKIETYLACSSDIKNIYKFSLSPKALNLINKYNTCSLCCKILEIRKQENGSLLNKAKCFTQFLFLQKNPNKDHPLFGQPTSFKFIACLKLLPIEIKRVYSVQMMQIWYRHHKEKPHFLSNAFGWNTKEYAKKCRELIRDVMKFVASEEIQRWFKNQKKRHYIAHYLHLHFSASFIQIWFKRKLFRMVILHYLHSVSLIFIIQMWYHKLKKIRNMLLHAQQCDAISSIMKWYSIIKVAENLQERAILMKTLMRIEGIKKYNEFRPSVTSDISEWYMIQMKDKIILKYAKKDKATLMIQKWIKKQRLRKHFLNYFRLNSKAKFIQIWYKKRKRNITKYFNNKNNMRVSRQTEVFMGDQINVQRNILTPSILIKTLLNAIITEIRNKSIKQREVNKNLNMLVNSWMKYKAAKSSKDNIRHLQKESSSEKKCKSDEKLCQVEKEIATIIIQKSIRAMSKFSSSVHNSRQAFHQTNHVQIDECDMEQKNEEVVASCHTRDRKQENGAPSTDNTKIQNNAIVNKNKENFTGFEMLKQFQIYNNFMKNIVTNEKAFAIQTWFKKSILFEILQQMGDI